jgi:hypothetical protein
MNSKSKNQPLSGSQPSISSHVSQENFVSRPIRLPDLGAALEVCQEGNIISPSERSLILATLGDLLATRRMFGVVVLDIRRPSNKQIVGVGAGGFITDEFHETLWAGKTDSYLLHAIAKQASIATKLPPSVSNAEASQYPVLDFDGVIARNHPQGGLHFAGLLFGDMAAHLSIDEAMAVRNRLLVSMTNEFRGYYLKTWTKEVYGNREYELFRDKFGAYLVRSYELSTLKEDRQPFLMGADREHALSPDRESSPVHSAFVWCSPKIHFTEAERKVLQVASRHGSDETISFHLGVTKITVRRQLDKALQRAEESAVVGKLYQSGMGKLISQATSRADRLQALVDYVKDYPEEVRPHWYSLQEIQ